MSPGFTPAPLCISLLMQSKCFPSIGVKELRNAKPLMVPRTGTRAFVPNVFCTSNGAARKHHAPFGPVASQCPSNLRHAGFAEVSSGSGMELREREIIGVLIVTVCE